MELYNRTPFAAEFTTAADRDGRSHLLLVAKSTWRLPLGGEPAQWMAEQQALVLADTATGEPGFSAPVEDCDFVLQKPRCEVLVLGSAYAPRGAAVAQVETGFKVGPLSKLMRVVGPRTWRGGMAVAPGAATPFVRQPLSYDIAFGGTNVAADGEIDACMNNPVGLGYSRRGPWDGMPMAQTEAIDQPVMRPDHAYMPLGFGTLGRHWATRARYAGTYDAHWQANLFPLLPPDFDPRFFQSAPEDQQLDVLQGGMPVTLLNLTHPALTPSGRLDFVLPDVSLDVVFYRSQGEPVMLAGRADTLVLQPDKQCFTVTWRASLPLRRDIREFEAIELRAPVPPAPSAPATGHQSNASQATTPHAMRNA